MTRTVLVVAASFAGGAVVATAVSVAVGAQDRQTQARELMRADLGEYCPGKEVLVTTSTNSVGSTARHFHPGYSFSVVTEGVQTVQPDGRPPYTARAGDLIYEEPFKVSQTRTTEPTKVVIVRILDKGQPATIPTQ